MRTRTRTARTARTAQQRPPAVSRAVIFQPSLPSGTRRLVWGMWPAPDARLTIAGVPGVWAFRHGIEYGHIKAVALVAWDDRADVMAAWRVAPLVAVSVEIEAA